MKILLPGPTTHQNHQRNHQLWNRSTIQAYNKIRQGKGEGKKGGPPEKASNKKGHERTGPSIRAIKNQDDQQKR